MPLTTILILFATHGIPILFFTYMTIDLFKRNSGKMDNILAGCIAFCYMILFVSEFLRNLVHIEYSPILSSVIFSSFGILIVCFGLHYILATTKISTKLSSLVTALICYSPVLLIIFNVVTGAQLFSTQSYEQIGVWIYPIYNINYYITLLGSLFANTMLVVPLYFVYKRTQNVEEKRVYKALLNAMIQLIILCFLLGILPLQNILPPYPYIYGGIYFCYILKMMMKRYQYFEQHDKRYEKLFTMNPFGIALLDNQFKVKEINPTAITFLEKHQIDLKTFVHLMDKKYRIMLLEEEKIENMEVKITIHNEDFYFLISMDQLVINFETTRFVILRDVTETRRQQEEIYYLAYHDTLTGIPNRRAFFEGLENELLLAHENDQIIVIYVVDMNNLKLLNDKLGHEAGDAVIKTVASILYLSVNQYGMAARIGGDEFIVYKRLNPSELNVEQYIQEMQDEFRYATSHLGDLPIGISIGWSCYPTESRSLDTLVSIADQRMYEMKKQKRVHYR